MAVNSNILNIPLDGTGTEIPTLNVTDPYEKYLITGANTTIGNYAIVPTGTPQQGTTFLFKYKATTDITTNGNTFAIFGQALTQNQLLIELDIECYYTGSAWVVEVKPSLTTAFVEAVNIVAGAIGSTQLANLSVTTGKINTNAVTNAKLAQMAAYTIKGNNTGVLADPQDITASTFVNANAWSLTGNSGTVAGTNFIGTTDAIDLVFKVNNTEAGRIKGNGSQNLSLGVSSLINVTTGNSNTSIGFQALNSLSSGSSNTGIGVFSSNSITSGIGNISIGNSSGTNVIDGQYNVCIGSGANVDSASAIQRIAIGKLASADADHQFAIPDDVTHLKFPLNAHNTGAVLISTSAGIATWSTSSVNTIAGDSATINAVAGRIRKDTSGSTFTLTNSYISANSIIFLTNTTAGITTGNQLSVVAGAGSAVITFETDGVAAAPSANMDINFWIVN